MNGAGHAQNRRGKQPRPFTAGRLPLTTEINWRFPANLQKKSAPIRPIRIFRVPSHSAYMGSASSAWMMASVCA